ncbi:MAG: helicase RepA family protein [Gammaproteobacteria bacterium]|nr:helicase RepA family protein [Gammaproteobacteria bacterium]
MINSNFPYEAFIGHNVPAQIKSGDLINGMVPETGIGFLVAEPGIGKSFLMLFLASILSNGRRFIHENHELYTINPQVGVPVKKAATLYLAGEREAGLAKRQKALLLAQRDHYGFQDISLDKDFLPIITCPLRNFHDFNPAGAIHLRTKTQRNYLKQLGYDTSLIVVDTLQSAFLTPHENGNSEMQRVINSIKAIGEHLNSFTFIVTHPAQGHGRGGGSYSMKGVPRGASSMRGNADIIWYLEKVPKTNLLKLTVTKGSEGYCEGHSFYFELKQFGESAALIPVEAPQGKDHKNIEDDVTLTENDLGVLKAMENACKTVPTEEKHTFYKELNIAATLRIHINTFLKRLNEEEAARDGSKPLSSGGIGNRITHGLRRLAESGLIASEIDSDGDTVFFPIRPWAEMPSYIHSKCPSVKYELSICAT